MSIVRDIMTSRLKTVLPDTPAIQVARLMANLKIGAVLVTAADQELLGIFTERDLIEMFKREPPDFGAKIAEHMTANPFTVEPSASIEAALSILTDKGVRHLPVVIGKKLVGIVSMRDFHQDQLALKLMGSGGLCPLCGRDSK
jgi:phosphoserine phosphatase RsbU/P